MDVYQSDPNRLFRNTRLGNVQAWGALASEASVAMSFYAGIQHADAQSAYVSQTLNLTAEDARDIARALIEAADHADMVRTDSNTDAKATTFGSAEAMS